MEALHQILSPDFLLRNSVYTSVLIGLACPLVGVFCRCNDVDWAWILSVLVLAVIGDPIPSGTNIRRELCAER